MAADFGPNATTRYQVLMSDGTWSTPVEESQLIDDVRSDVGGISTRRDARIRESATGKEYAVQDSPLLAAILRSISVEASGQRIPEGGSSLTHESMAQNGRVLVDTPRLRGCPNCKRMVSIQAKQCPACGQMFRTRFDEHGNAVPPVAQSGTNNVRMDTRSNGSSQNMSSGDYVGRQSAPLGGIHRPEFFDPYAGLGDRETLVLREFARQRTQFMWWAIIGLFFSASLFSLLLTLYGIVRIHTIRQSVAELGVDPNLWSAYEGKRFWKSNGPSLAVCTFVVIGAIAILTITAYNLMDSISSNVASDSTRSAPVQ